MARRQSTRCLPEQSSKLRPLAYAAVLTGTLLGQAAHGQCQYEVTVIAGPSGIRAFGINEAGHIVGDYRATIPSDWNPFVWTEAGGFEPIPVAALNYGRGLDINNLGHVVGFVDLLSDDDDGIGHVGFVFDGLTFSSLGTLPGGTWSEAFAINNRNQIVGMAYNANNDQRAFLWEAGEMADFGALLGTPSSRAKHISDRGDIIGWMGTSYLNDGQGFHWRNGDLTPLGVLPGMSVSIAEAINADGEIVGWGLFPGQNRPILWKDGTMRNLGALPGVNRCAANDINDRGQIIGSCWDPGLDGFIWQNGAMTCLEDLVLHEDMGIHHAYGINNAGQIVAYGNADGMPAAFLLTPVPGPSGDVDGDCRVGTSDLLDLLAQWGRCDDLCFADINGDGVVGIDDLVTLIEHWG